MGTSVFGSIFDYPGLDKNQFAAAAFVLETKRHQQASLEPIEANGGTRQHHKDSDLGRFLDSIAYVFGRYKGKRAAAHVSATALYRSPDANSNSTILVTKNNCFENDDEKFASDLQDWFDGRVTPGLQGLVMNANHLKALFRECSGSTLGDKILQGSDQGSDGAVHGEEVDNPEDDSHDTVAIVDEEKESVLDEEMWHRIIAFCHGRQLQYIAHIVVSSALNDPELDARLSEEDKNTVSKARQVVECCQKFRDQIEDTTTSTDPSKLVKSVQEICTLSVGFRRRDKSRDDEIWQKAQEKPNAQERTGDRARPKDPRPLFAAIHMLGRLRADWGKIKQYKASTGQKFNIKILRNDEWKNLKLDATAVRKTIDERWPHHDQLGKPPLPIVKFKYTFFFHCEIQMLHYIRSNKLEDHCENYFGCSKKSCWMCWTILSHDPKFKTGDTHAKAFWKCAFPFPRNPQSNADKVIVRALLALQRTMTDQVVDMILATDAWKRPAEVKQTTDHDTNHPPADELESPVESDDESAPGRLKRPVRTVQGLRIAPDGTDSLEQIRFFETDPSHLLCLIPYDKTKCIAPEFLISKENHLHRKDDLPDSWTHFSYHFSITEQPRVATDNLLKPQTYRTVNKWIHAFFQYGISDADSRNEFTLTSAMLNKNPEIVNNSAWWHGDIYLVADDDYDSGFRSIQDLPDDPPPCRARILSDFGRLISDTIRYVPSLPNLYGKERKEFADSKAKFRESAKARMYEEEAKWKKIAMDERFKRDPQQTDQSSTVTQDEQEDVD